MQTTLRLIHMPRDYDVTARAGAGNRWVCQACGKHSAPDGTRISLGDTACVIAAVVCEAKRDADGRWILVAADSVASIRFTARQL